jgi:hypothetical protein
VTVTSPIKGGLGDCDLDVNVHLPVPTKSPVDLLKYIRLSLQLYHFGA